MIINKNNEENIERKKIYNLINKLIKDNKIKFSFYESNQPTLDLVQICHSEVDE